MALEVMELAEGKVLRLKDMREGNYPCQDTMQFLTVASTRVRT